MASKTATPQPVAQPSTSIADLVGEWIRQGAEGFIATQKILLDLAAQQNALALTILRERLGLFSPTPSKTVLDLAGKSMKNFVEGQKILLDIAARQNDIVADGLKPALSGTLVEGMAEVVHKGLNNFLAAQKEFLTFFETETEGVVADLADGKGFKTSRLADLAREGMRDFLHSQKRFLDIVEHNLVTKKEPAATGAEEHKRVDLFDMAKQSVDAYVKAQQRLLDLTADQVNVNVKMAREMFNVNVPNQPPTTLPEVLKKSVDSFVAAQKALVDLASKPKTREEHEHERERELAAAK